MGLLTFVSSPNFSRIDGNRSRRSRVAFALFCRTVKSSPGLNYFLRVCSSAISTAPRNNSNGKAPRTTMSFTRK